jgi:hypothetical protein
VWEKGDQLVVEVFTSCEGVSVGGRLLTGWLKSFPVVRLLSLGGSLLTDWLNLFPVVRCKSVAGSLSTSMLK